MTAKPKTMDDGLSVTVRVPISIRRRGGRKLILAPDSAKLAASPIHRHPDNTMVKAIARAFRWRKMLENGDYSTVREIAIAEKINESYVGRVLRLTLLAPEIVEAILSGCQPGCFHFEVLMKRFPLDWTEQQVAFRLKI